MDPEDLIRRLELARESLDTELKPWLDPKSDEGKAEIARTCLALRNNNGGVLIIGIRDDGSVDKRTPFDDVRKTFHHDIVQEIVTKCSSETFEITVHFVERGNAERVMIEVPRGIRTPVFCRTDMPKQPDGKGRDVGELLRQGTFFVRTLTANGRPSTAPAGASDWPRMMEHCFNNREADIGAFLRRQLSAIDVTAASSALADILQTVRKPAPEALAIQFLDECFERFQQLRRNRRPVLPDCGTREAAAIIVGDFSHPDLTQEYMLRLGTQIPRYSGWSPWVALMNVYAPQSQAAYVGDGWESLIYNPQLFNLYDFARIEESGRFYYLEGLRDDLVDQVPPKTYLEYIGEIKRVTEIVAVALFLAKIFCGQSSDNEISVALRWKGLAGRMLAAWGHGDNVATAHKAQDDEKIAYVTLPIATPPNAIGLHVETLLKPLFRAFGGHAFDSQLIQHFVDERLSGRR